MVPDLANCDHANTPTQLWQVAIKKLHVMGGAISKDMVNMVSRGDESMCRKYWEQNIEKGKFGKCDRHVLYCSILAGIQVYKTFLQPFLGSLSLEVPGGNQHGFHSFPPKFLAFLQSGPLPDGIITPNK